MKWFVSRKVYDAAVNSAVDWYNKYTDARAKLEKTEAVLRATRAELEMTTKRLDTLRWMEERERHRRLALQGEVQYRDERMRRALGLITTPPPAPSVDDGWDVEKTG